MRLILLVCVFAISFAYEENLGKEYWYYASASYCRESKITAWSCGAPCNKGSKASDVKFFYNSSHDSAGFSSYNTVRNHIVLTFRGTVPWNIKNWLSDINFIKVDYEHCDNACQVHRGFLRAYKEVEEQMFAQYQALRNKYPNAPLVVTGHSLGGAIAHHALVHLKKRGIKVDIFITYGSPRVGDEKFSTFLKNYHTAEKVRVTHGFDPVPHVPTASMGFKHVPTEVYRYLGKYTICNDAVNEDPKCSNKHILDLNIDEHTRYYDLDQLITTPLCQ